LAKGGQRRVIDHREQAEPVEFGRDTPPLVAHVGAEKRRRLRALRLACRLRLGSQRPLRWISANDTMPFSPKIIGSPILPAIHGGITGAFLETAAIIGVTREGLGHWEAASHGHYFLRRSRANRIA
jgi:hypothetical protein